MDEEDFSLSVYTSLINEHRMLGIGELPVGCILIVTLFFASTISWWMLLFGAVAILVLRKLCKNDIYVLDFLFESLNQVNFYRG